MGGSRLLCNLNFHDPQDFQCFVVQGYRFEPIHEKQPKRRLITLPRHVLSANVNHAENARVILPGRQVESVLRQSGRENRKRRAKLLYDLGVLASILAGRNVVQSSLLRRSGFPPAAANHCEMVAHNSTDLERMMTVASTNLLDTNWQARYQMGFHVLKLYNASNVYVKEPRFLASMVIWEFVYATELMKPPHSPLDYYQQLRDTGLNTKLCVLTRKHLIHAKNMTKDRLDVFIHLRNQLTHYGRLPVTIPSAPSWLSSLSVEGCEKYMDLFFALTQVLVLKTLGIDAWPHLTTSSINTRADELFSTGQVAAFHR